MVQDRSAIISRRKGGTVIEVEQYWDKVAWTKEFTTPFPHERFQSFARAEDHILDVGCGYGRTLQELWGRGYRNLAGVDLSSEMIRRGKALFPHLELRAARGDELPFDDESQDVVLLFAVLTSIPQDLEQERVIREVLRVLRPGGVLLVNDFLLNDDERNLARYRKDAGLHGPFGTFVLPDGGVMRHHDSVHMKKLLASLDEAIFEETLFRTMNGNASRGVLFVGRKP